MHHSDNLLGMCQNGRFWNHLPILEGPPTPIMCPKFFWPGPPWGEKSGWTRFLEISFYLVKQLITLTFLADGEFFWFFKLKLLLGLTLEICKNQTVVLLLERFLGYITSIFTQNEPKWKFYYKYVT